MLIEPAERYYKKLLNFLYKRRNEIDPSTIKNLDENSNKL